MIKVKYEKKPATGGHEFSSYYILYIIFQLLHTASWQTITNRHIPGCSLQLSHNMIEMCP